MSGILATLRRLFSRADTEEGPLLVPCFQPLVVTVNPVDRLVRSILEHYRPVIHLQREWKLGALTGTWIPVWRALPCAGFDPFSEREREACPRNYDPVAAYLARLRWLMNRDGHTAETVLLVATAVIDRRMDRAEASRRAQEKLRRSAEEEQAWARTERRRRWAQEMTELLTPPGTETPEQFETRMCRLRSGSNIDLMDAAFLQRHQQR